MPGGAVPSNEAIDNSGFNPLLLCQLRNSALGRRRSRGASISSLRATKRLGQPLHHHDRPLCPRRRAGRACAERSTHPLGRPKFRAPVRRARRAALPATAACLGLHWPVRAGARLAFAVSRGDDGRGGIVAMAPKGDIPAWRGRMWDAGACELHVYILVNDEAGRAEVAIDFSG